MLRTCYFLKTLILRNGEKIKFCNKESKKTNCDLFKNKRSPTANVSKQYKKIEIYM